MAKGKVVHRLWYSTEPYLLFYVTALTLHNPIFQQFVYKRISEQYNLPYTYDQKQSCGTKDFINGSVTEVRKKVQAETSKYEIGYVMFSSLPSAIVSLFMGSMSDRFGRKPVLILSLLGSVLQGGLILMVMFMKLPLWMIFVAGCFNGVGGYMAGLLLATFAYVADVTEPERRGVRLAYVEGIVFLGATVSSSASGHLIDAVGFEKAYTVVWSLFCGALLYVVFVLPESLPPSARQSILDQSTGNYRCMPIVKIYRVLTKNRPQKWKLKCLVPATMFINMLQMGMGSVTILYLLNRPLCLAAVDVGYVMAAKHLFVGIGAAFGIKVLSKFIADYVLIPVGFCSHIGGFVLLAFAGDKGLVYAAAAVSLFAGFPGPLFRSALSRSVDAYEQGAMFSFVTTLEMLFQFIGTLTFNSFYTYANSKLDFGGAVFLLNCVVSLLPFILAIVYGIVSRLSSVDSGYRSIIISEEGSIQSPNDELVPSGSVTPDYGSNGHSQVVNDCES